MQNALSSLLNFIALNLLLEKSWDDFCAVAKIKPKDWPDCLAKTVALEYHELKMAEGHDMAAVQLSGYIEKLQGDVEFPEDPGIFKAYYDSTLKEFKAKRLASKLIDDPLNAEKYISGFQNETAKDELLSFAEQAEGIFRESVRLAEAGQAIRRIPRWGILSSLIGGFNPGRVGMLLAQTGFGKSTAAVNLSLGAASKFSVVYFNMEMLGQDFGEKLILASMRESFITLKNAPLSIKKKMGEALPWIYNSRLFYSQGRALSPQEIFAICRKHKSEHGIDFIIVDYDQKLVMQTGKDTPEWKALQIAVEQFEVLAKELECFVLILAQEGSDGEVSGSKRSKFPASTVLRFYKTERPNPQQNQSKDVYLIEAVKNRFGKRGAAVEVTYEADKSFIQEVGEFEQSEIKRTSSVLSGSSSRMEERRGAASPYPR